MSISCFRAAWVNRTAQFLYIVKCIYLLISAWQIRNGYPVLCTGNLITHAYGLTNMVLFKMLVLTSLSISVLRYVNSILFFNGFFKDSWECLFFLNFVHQSTGLGQILRCLYSISLIWKIFTLLYII